MATTQLKTRILNKISTFAEWEAVKTTFKPLRGEICIVEIPTSTTGSGLTPPAFGMKVGDGTNFFGDLQWIQAIAGDVTAWCKKNMTDAGKFEELVKNITITTDETLETAISNLKTRIQNLEDTVNNETTGINAVKITADTAKSKAETNTNDIKTINESLNEIKETIGLGVTGDTSLTQRVTALETSNTDRDKKIQNNTDEIGKEVTRATTEEGKLSTRLEKVETFFVTAEGETLNTALDTLVEIQKYISSEGSEVQQMIDDIATNKSNIATLQTVVNTTLPGLITTAQTDADTANTEIGKIKDGTTKVKNAETADNATNATNAANATNATNATKATQDASGNVIVDTYETKADATTKLTDAKSDATNKANTAEQNAKDYVDAEIGKLDGAIADGDGLIATATQTDGKLVSSTRRKVKMSDISDTDTFVFYCGSATEVI